MRKDQFFLEKKFGFERAKFFWNIGLEAVQTVTNLIKKYEIDCALRQGIMHVGNTKRDYKYFVEEMNHMEKKYNYSNYEYRRQPWERQAYRLQEILLREWKKYVGSNKCCRCVSST